MTKAGPGARRYFYWIGGGIALLALFVAGTFSLLVVFDEAAYWRALLRKGDYQKLDVIFTQLETDNFNPFEPMAWVFRREIRQRFAQFDLVKSGLSITAREIRAAAGASCPTGAGGGGEIRQSAGAKLCAIEFRVTNQYFGAYVMAAVENISGQTQQPSAFFSTKRAFLKAGKVISLMVNLKPGGAEPGTYRIIAIASQRQRMGTPDWLSGIHSKGETDDLIRRAARLGLVLVTKNHAAGK